MQSHALILDKAIGLSPEKSEEANVNAMEQYFDPSDAGEGQQKRHDVEAALKDLDLEFYAHGAEVGWFYDLPYQGCFDAPNMPNRQRNGDGSMELCEYRPTTRPGNQLPHAFLEHQTSKVRKSTRELPRQGQLLLIGFSSAWKCFSHQRLHCELIDDEGDWKPIDDELSAQYEDVQRQQGALIVRPDRIIAYRFADDTVLREANAEYIAQRIVKKILRQDLGK